MLPGGLSRRRLRRYEQEVLQDNPLAWLRLDEATGASSWADSAPGRNRTAASIGSGGTGSNPTAGEPGLVTQGRAVRCSGKRIALGSVALSVNSFSLELWVTPRAAATGEQVLACLWQPNDETSGSGPWISIDSAGKVRGDIYVRINRDAGLTVSRATSSSALAVGTRYHVVLTSNGSSLALFINGSSAGYGSWNFGTTSSNWITRRNGSTQLNVGGIAATSGYQATDAHIDEVALYASELSSARILAHYNAGIAAAP